MSGDASGALALTCALLFAQLVVPLALFAWGRQIARQRASEPRWRWASRLPLVGLAISVLGYVVPAASVVIAFATADAAGRATALARAIAMAMNIGAVTLALSMLIWICASIALAYGAFARPAR